MYDSFPLRGVFGQYTPWTIESTTSQGNFNYL